MLTHIKKIAVGASYFRTGQHGRCPLSCDDMQKYRFRPYSPEYKRYFQLEKRRLEKIIGRGLPVEHIGSTAVPGLGGKGIVDILIVGPKRRMLRASGMIQGRGYEFRPGGGTGERLFHQKDLRSRDGKTRRVHVHLVFSSSRNWREVVAVRDHLRAHPQAAAEYARIKRRAATVCRGDKEIYRRCKEAFLKDLTRKAMSVKGAQGTR